MRFGNKNEGEMQDFLELAKELVIDQYNNDGIGTPRGEAIQTLQHEEVYIVWFSKTLQNWKALVSTMRPDDRYYEITFNGDKNEVYIDTYLKTHNICRTLG